MRDCLSLCSNEFSSIIIALVRVSTLVESEQLYPYMKKLGSEEQFLCFTFSAGHIEGKNKRPKLLLVYLYRYYPR